MAGLDVRMVGPGGYGLPGRGQVGPRPQMSQFSGYRGMGGSMVPASPAFGRPMSTTPRSAYLGSSGFNRGAAAGNAPRHNDQGVVRGQSTMGPGNAIQQARAQGPDQAAIEAEMRRRNMGAGMGPGNAALSGYMMG